MRRQKHFKWATRIGLGLFAFWLTLSLWQASIIPSGETFHDSIRGVWLTNYGTAFSYYTTRLDELTANLKQHHINTLYPAVWNRGGTLHPSDVVQSAGGPTRNRLTSLPLLPFQNSLSSLVYHAHRQDLKVIPWFEYGLWVPANSAIAQTHPDWLTTTLDGSITHTPAEAEENSITKTQAWLNPSHPEVQNFGSSGIPVEPPHI